MGPSLNQLFDLGTLADDLDVEPVRIAFDGFVGRLQPPLISHDEFFVGVGIRFRRRPGS